MAKRLKWGTVEYLEQLIDEYFEQAQEKGEMPSITGLRIYIDMSEDVWKYYCNDLWKTKRKTPEEIEEIEQKEAQRLENSIFEDNMEIIDSGKVSEGDDIGETRIKERLSTALKKARDRIDYAVTQCAVKAKNPAYFIFYQKAALGYRETAPEQTEQNRLPAAINIVVLPPPEKPQAINAIEAQFQVIDENPQSLDTTALQTIERK
jgi:hypothetical protein